jgi:hypothetical protein
MRTRTTEQQIRGSDAVADWVILLSGYEPEVVDSAAADRFSSTALNLLGAREKSIMGRYKLSFAMTPLDLMQTPTGAYLSPQRSN